MTDAPLLIGCHETEPLLASLDAALDQGCHGIRFDLEPKPFAGSLLNGTRRSRYPRLRDVFDYCDDRLFLDVGLNTRGLEAEILEVVRACPARSNYIVSSALPEVVMELKARSAAVPVGLLCKRAAELACWPELPADYVIVHYPLITRKLVRSIHRHGRRVFAWRVNDARTMIRLSGWGVDGIISNHAQLLMQTLG